MSLVVVPRLALLNQQQVLKHRSDLVVDLLIPNITGLAQINGKDNLPDKDKAHFDSVYCHQNSILIDFASIIISKLWQKNISH